MNTATFLTKQAMQNRERTALSHGDRTLTYAELARRSLSLGAGLLDMGLSKGDRVALMLPNGTEVVESIYGCLAAGLVVVPINYRLHPYEAAYIVENSGAGAFILDQDFADRIPPGTAVLDTINRICVSAGSADSPYERLVRSSSPLRAPVDVGAMRTSHAPEGAWDFSRWVSAKTTAAIAVSLGRRRVADKLPHQNDGSR